MGTLNLRGLNNKHLLVLTGNSMLSVVGFALAALLFHSLSMADVGMWFFVQSIIAFCETARYGFLSTAAVKFYAGTEPERGKTVIGSIWYLAIMITIVVLILNACAIAVLPYSDNKELWLSVKWVGVTFLATLPSDVISWKLQAEEKYNTMLRFRILNSSCSILLFTALVVLGKLTLETAFLINFLVNVLTSVTGIACKISGISNLRCRSASCIREVVHYGKYTFGTTTGSFLLLNADTWIINFLLGPVAVAIYNVAMRLMALVELPLRSFAVTCMSAMAIAFNKKNMEQVTAIFMKYSGMLTVAFIPFAFIILLAGDLAIHLMGGNDYVSSEAANVYKAAMFIAILYPIERLNGVTLDIIHLTRVNFIKVVLMLVLKIAGDFSFVIIFNSVYGIILSKFIVHVFAFQYGNYQLQKHLKYSVQDILATGLTEMRSLIRNSMQWAGLTKK